LMVCEPPLWEKNLLEVAAQAMVTCGNKTLSNMSSVSIIVAIFEDFPLNL
jgi:hypothetical protein